MEISKNNFEIRRILQQYKDQLFICQQKGYEISEYNIKKPDKWSDILFGKWINMNVPENKLTPTLFREQATHKIALFKNYHTNKFNKAFQKREEIAEKYRAKQGIYLMKKISQATQTPMLSRTNIVKNVCDYLGNNKFTYHDLIKN